MAHREIFETVQLNRERNRFNYPGFKEGAFFDSRKKWGYPARVEELIRKLPDQRATPRFPLYEEGSSSSDTDPQGGIYADFAKP